MPQASLDHCANILAAYREARAEMERWKEASEVLRRRIEAAMGDADEGIIDGRRVITYRREGAFSPAKFMQEQRELAEKYSRERTGTEIDIERLRQDFPHIYQQYRSRPFVLHS